MNKEIPYRNKAAYGWWIASYMQRMQWHDSPAPSERSRCIAWENTILIQAADREAAYEKAVSIGSQDGGEFQNEDETKTGEWVFEGLTELLPLYEDIEDGAEILWKVHDGRTVGKIRSFTKKKDELSVFDDSE